MNKSSPLSAAWIAGAAVGGPADAMKSRRARFSDAHDSVIPRHESESRARAILGPVTAARRHLPGSARPPASPRTHTDARRGPMAAIVSAIRTAHEAVGGFGGHENQDTRS